MVQCHKTFVVTVVTLTNKKGGLKNLRQRFQDVPQVSYMFTKYTLHLQGASGLQGHWTVRTIFITFFSTFRFLTDVMKSLVFLYPIFS